MNKEPNVSAPVERTVRLKVSGVCVPDKSWKIEALNLIADGEFCPGLDIVALLKDFDGLDHQFSVSLRIPMKIDAPRIAIDVSMADDFTSSRGEADKINSVLLSFSKPQVIAEFIRNVSSHLHILASLLEKDLSNVKLTGRGPES